MSKFKRIVREALVMGGQARIRDTGITVNEIVRLSLDGKSQAEILEDFPQLEAEDVHQALGYVIDDTVTTVKYSANDGLTPLTVIQSFIGLILSNNTYLSEHNDFKEPSEEQKHQFLEVVFTNAEKARFVWQKLYDRIQLNFNRAELFARSIKGILSPLTSKDRYYTYEIHSKVNQDSKISGVLQVINLVALLLEEFAFITHVVVHIGEKNNVAIFSIIIEGELMDSLQVVTQSYFPIGMASLMLYLSGSELKVEQMNDKVTFEFALPIVEDDAG